MSACLDVAPIARNTFKILKPPPHLRNYEDDDNDAILRIGQPFCLSCNDSLLILEKSNLLAPPLYLCSTLKNERSATKTSNRQTVYLSASCDSEAVWTAVVPSKGKIASFERTLAVGAPIYADETYVIAHRQTNSYLTVDTKHNDLTDFGSEYECFLENSHTTGKLFLLRAEELGTSTPSTLVKTDIPTNYWHFVTGRNPESGRETRSIPPPATVDSVFDELYQYIRSRGIEGFLLLRQEFMKLDSLSGGDNKLDKGDVIRLLQGWGVIIDGQFLDLVLNELNQYNNLIDYKEFLTILRGPLSDYRREMIQNLYQTLDDTGEGFVSFETASKAFRPDNHPLIGSGRITSTQLITNQFKNYFVHKGKTPSYVKYSDFEDYLADISVNVDIDDEFAGILRRLFSV